MEKYNNLFLLGGSVLGAERGNGVLIAFKYFLTLIQGRRGELGDVLDLLEERFQGLSAVGASCQLIGLALIISGSRQCPNVTIVLIGLAIVIT